MWKPKYQQLPVAAQRNLSTSGFKAVILENKKQSDWAVPKYSGKVKKNLSEFPTLYSDKNGLG